MNIGIYGATDKRPLIFALLKLLQDFGTVLFITPEYHYRRMIDGVDSDYFQNVLVVARDEPLEESIEYIEISPEAFDFVIIDFQEYMPTINLDIVFSVSCYQDEFIVDDTLNSYENVVDVKMNFDNKVDKEAYNIKITTKLLQYVEMVEAYKMLPPMAFRDISIILEKELAGRLDVPEKTIKKILLKEWTE